jgi:hypothetical protein
MKVGFIVESGPEGPEVDVIPFLANLVDQSLEVDKPVSLGDKDKLRRDCGPWVKKLLDRGCERVLIVWDLMPDWGEYEGRGCRHDDKEQVASSLARAGLNSTDPRIKVVCIEQMLESWVLADNMAVSEFISTPEHRIQVPKSKAPDRIRFPEAVLNRSFRTSRFRKYRDLDHAFGIIIRAKLNRLRRSYSFSHFEEKLTE